MNLSWTLAALVWLHASTGAAANCDTYTDCNSCVENDCAFTAEAVCTSSCEGVVATIDCFSTDNYKGLNGPEICNLAGFEVSLAVEPETEQEEVAAVPPVVVEEEEATPSLPDVSEIGGSATIGEEPEDECPTGEGMCTMEYAPVRCGDCEYDNVCGARLAGFNAVADCVFVTPPEDIACPTPADGVCTSDYTPVACGTCEYSNACTANLAGFDADTECALVNGPEDATACPTGEGMCTYEYEPVLCGDCEYSNACGAELAGFVVPTDCALVNATEVEEDFGVPSGSAMQSPCNKLPTCETCLSARMDCKWSLGACFEGCVSDTSCWSPQYQQNMTPPEICELAAQEDVVDEASSMAAAVPVEEDVDVVAGKNVNAAELASAAAVQQGVWAAVASVVALWVAAV